MYIGVFFCVCSSTSMIACAAECACEYVRKHSVCVCGWGFCGDRSFTTDQNCLEYLCTQNLVGNHSNYDVVAYSHLALGGCLPGKRRAEITLVHRHRWDHVSMQAHQRDHFNKFDTLGLIVLVVFKLLIRVFQNNQKN